MTSKALIFIVLSFAILIIILVYLFLIIRMMAKKRKDDEKKDSTEVGFVVDTFHDLVTALKSKEREMEALKMKAEERASDVEIYNENILQSVPSGVVGFDERLAVTKMNSAAEKILGLNESETVGRAYDEIFGSPVSGFIGSDETIERTETSYVTKTGRRIWLGLNISPLKDSSGAKIGRILVFTDLTELKAFQSQMELRDRLSSLGEMSAGIAHELRNPMAVISGYTKILSKKADEPLMPAVDAISKEVSVMDRIITDFLSFARPSEPVMTGVDLNEIIRDSVSSAGKPDSVKVELDLDALPTASVDAVLMRQAIGNLIQNAFEAMPDGGILTLRTYVGDSLSISVSDTGHGISGPITDKIYLPFFTTKERGTGLGLSIVHKIVVSHGGNMQLETGAGGTTFTINLPKKLVVTD